MLVMKLYKGGIGFHLDLSHRMMMVSRCTPVGQVTTNDQMNTSPWSACVSAVVSVGAGIEFQSYRLHACICRPYRASRRFEDVTKAQSNRIAPTPHIVAFRATHSFL